MLESSIENPVVLRAERAGWFVRKIGWIGRRHAPDRLFAHPARGIVFIEFKRPGEDARLGQKIEHRRMREAGIEVHVCDNVQDALRILGLAGHDDDLRIRGQRAHKRGAPKEDWQDLV